MRLLLRTSLLACVLAGNLSGLAAEPVYIDLPGNDRAPASLQSEPVPISRSPTVLSMALSDDSMRLRAVDINGNVRQWSVSPPKQEGVIISLDEEPICAALSADAKWLASADAKGGVTVTDLENGKQVFRDDAREENTVVLSFSKDALRLGGVTAKGAVRVWDTQSGKAVSSFKVTPGSVQSLSISDDGKLLALASFGREVAVHGLSDSSQRETISIDRSRVTSIAITPGGDQLVIAAADGTMRLVDLDQPKTQRALTNHPFAVWTLKFADDGRLAAGSWDGTVRLFNPSSWEVLQSVKANQESICAILLNEQGMVAAGMDGRMFYWPLELPSRTQHGLIRGKSDQVWVAACSPNGKHLYVGGHGQRSELWDMESKQRRGVGPLHPTVRCAAYSPDGTRLATAGDDRMVVVASAGDGEIFHRLAGHRGLVSTVVFIEDGKTLISGCDRGFLKFWDVRSGTEVASRKRHQQQLYCAAVSPDEKLLVTGGGHWAKGDPGELIVWDLQQRRFKKALEGHTLTVWSIVFAPDGSYFATSDSAGEVKIWNTETLQLQRTLKHQTWVRPLAMSPDGRTLAVGRGDGSIRLWDTTTWNQTAVCNGHDNFTFWLSYSPDGKTLVSGGDDGTVRFWRTR